MFAIISTIFSEDVFTQLPSIDFCGRFTRFLSNLVGDVNCRVVRELVRRQGTMTPKGSLLKKNRIETSISVVGGIPLHHGKVKQKCVFYMSITKTPSVDHCVILVHHIGSTSARYPKNIHRNASVA